MRGMHVLLPGRLRVSPLFTHEGGWDGGNADVNSKRGGNR